jgi:hypothetical protein
MAKKYISFDILFDIINKWYNALCVKLLAYGQRRDAMKGKQANWLLGFVALITTLAILVGGQLLWQKFAVAKPLDKLLQDVDGVVTATQSDVKGGKDNMVLIDVTLQNVNNLQNTYTEIDAGAKRILGSKPYTVAIHDKRNGELEQFYYSIHYFVQEAIFTGNFSQMAQRVKEQSQAQGIDTRIYVDTRFVFVQMQQGDGQMYVVVPRPTASAEVK